MGLRPRLRSIAAPVQVPFKSRASGGSSLHVSYLRCNFLLTSSCFKKTNRLLFRSRFAMEMRGLGLAPPPSRHSRSGSSPLQSDTSCVLLWTFPVWRKSAGRFTLLTASGAVHHQPNNWLYRRQLDCLWL